MSLNLVKVFLWYGLAMFESFHYPLSPLNPPYLLCVPFRGEENIYRLWATRSVSIFNPSNIQNGFFSKYGNSCRGTYKLDRKTFSYLKCDTQKQFSFLLFVPNQQGKNFFKYVVVFQFRRLWLKLHQTKQRKTLKQDSSVKFSERLNLVKNIQSNI